MYYTGQQLHIRRTELLESSIRKGKHSEYIQVTRNGKTFQQLRSINDKIESSPGLQFIEMMSHLTSDKQKAFFSWQLRESRPCKIEPAPKNIRKGKPQIKQCFKNSIDVVLQNSDVKYVEGFVTFHGIHIEHAWNKIGDKYFDVTREGPLSKHSDFDEYVSIIELSGEEVYKQMHEVGYYGPFLNNYYNKTVNK